jgi:hypothetical protein
MEALRPCLLLRLRRAGVLMQMAKQGAQGYDAFYKCTIQMFQLF